MLIWKLPRQIISLCKSLFLLLVTECPGEIGYSLRWRFWSRRLRHLGRHTKIEPGVIFQRPELISIGENCWIDRHVVILAGKDFSNREKIVLRNRRTVGREGEVVIGNNIHIGIGTLISGIDAGVVIEDNCGFSAGCRVFAFSHHFRSHANPHDASICFGPMVPMEKQCLISGGIYLGRNVGVALGAVILPGVEIAENCFVAPGAHLLAGRFRSNSMISGNPAVRSGERYKEQKPSDVT